MIFLVMIEREKKIEIRKQVLISIKSFNPYDLFKRLSSQDDLGYISPKILCRYLKQLGFQTNKKETAAFVRSLNLQDKINYQDWLTFLLPSRKRYSEKKLLERWQTSQVS